MLQNASGSSTSSLRCVSALAAEATVRYSNTQVVVLIRKDERERAVMTIVFKGEDDNEMNLQLLPTGCFSYMGTSDIGAP